jgi:NAD(P)-dependent dehydrogenase (short-subunit alcohol dehydrogenase family)
MRMVLTGCASGIGRHLAGALARRGHQILATDLDELALLAAAEREGWSAESVVRRKLDVRSEVEWEAVMEAAESELGGLDVLFNIAGYLNAAYVTDFTQRDLDLHLDVNAKGTMLGTRSAARRMIKAGSGHIVNIGSLASLAPVPGLSLYSASKFAVRGFTLAAATELRPRGVAVTLIMPDAVETPMLEKQVDRDEAALTFSGSKALTVEDIARLIIDRVLPDKPLEVTIPHSRGLLARIANSAPEVAKALTPMLQKKGRKRQDEIKSGGRH